MEVILLKEVSNLGNPGEIVKVKNGFARNYLLPNKHAVLKSKNSLLILEKQKEEFAKQIAEKNEQYKQILEKLNEIKEITIEARAGDDEKLFGTITNQNIADQLNKDNQLQIDKKNITLKKHIKLLGNYSASIQLNKEFKMELGLNVVKKGES